MKKRVSCSVICQLLSSFKFYFFFFFSGSFLCRRSILLLPVFTLLITPSVMLSQSGQGILKGFIIDRKTDQKLQNAVVIILGTEKGVTSNHKGYFEIPLPEGEYTVEARMLGYQSLRKQCLITADEKTSLFFELDPVLLSTEEIPVTGRRYDRVIKSKSMELQPGDLKNIPQFGEADPFRALQALPGVNTINDIGNQIYLRGGNFDETLISLDDVPLYNPYHLGGIFSSVNSDIISREKLYLSNYPQSLGGYLSGALELSSKTGRSDLVRTSASIGLISSRGYIEGPLWKGTFVSSARRTYLDALNIFYPDASFPYYFYDIYSKYSLPVDEKNIFNISGFYSGDVLKEEYTDGVLAPKWGNLLFSAKWIHLFDVTSELDLQAYLSRSFMGMDKIKDGTYIDNLISDATLKAEYNRSGEGWLIHSGLEFKYLRTSYSWFDNYSRLRDYINPPEEVFFDYAPNPYSYSNSAHIISSFIAGQYNATDRLLLKPALRGCYLADTDYFIACPSAGLDYILTESSTISLSYGRYYQYLYTLKEKRPESLYSPFSVLFISEGSRSVSVSDHFSAAITIKEIRREIDADIEIYYKKRDDLASSYSEHPRIRFEDGYAAGVDVMLRKERGILTGWIGYSYGKSIKRNETYSYYTNYDRRHSFKLLMGFQLSEKWKLNAFWTWATGTPYTGITGKYLGGVDLRSSRSPYFFPYGTWRCIDGAKNSLRVDGHHRLDLGITGSFIWGKLLVSPYLQILNAYCSPNQIVMNNNLEYQSDESLEFQNSFIIPTLGVGIEF